MSNFFRRNFEFSPIFYEKSQFSGPPCFTNYVTPYPIVVILVHMERGDQYLSIDTKTKFKEGSVAKFEGGCNSPLG